MARKKKTDEEPAIAPEVKEEVNPGQTEASVPEVNDTLEELKVEAEREAMPSIEGVAAPVNAGGLAVDRPAPRVKAAEEIAAQRRADGQALMRDALETAKTNSERTLAGEAIDQEAAALSNTPDFEKTQSDTIRELENKSFAQWAIDMKKADEERLAEERQQIEDERRAAKMTGFAEFGSALANLLGVAEGNAVSQTYKQYSQDWMRKADADAREHRNRIADLRKRQRDTELKMAQLRQSGLRASIQEARERERDRLANEYQKARIAYENARTESEKAEAAQKARKVEAEIQRIATQMGADLALAQQRIASAAASTTNANTRKADSERKGNQQDRLTDSKVNLNEAKVNESESRAALNWSRATGQPYSGEPGWSVKEEKKEKKPATASYFDD